MLTQALVLCAMLLVAQDSTPAPKSEPNEQPSTIMAVPDEVASLGTVYHCITGRERQISFISDAPLETIKGHSNTVAGYAVMGPAESPAALRAGEWKLLVSSLRTGNRTRDTHLTQENWLYAARHPFITFTLRKVEAIATKPADPKSADPKQPKQPADAYTATLVGEMTIRGETRELSLPGATIAFLKESEETRAVAPGDLMRITVSYKVNLAEFGVKNDPVIMEAKKVAEVIEVTTDLVLTTVPPTAVTSPKEPAAPQPAPAK